MLERCTGAVGVEPAPDHEKGLLGNVLDVLGVRKESAGEPEYPSLVLPDELCEGVGVPFAAGVDQASLFPGNLGRGLAPQLDDRRDAHSATPDPRRAFRTKCQMRRRMGPLHPVPLFPKDRFQCNRPAVIPI